jgi:hypothetical protein
MGKGVGAGAALFLRPGAGLTSYDAALFGLVSLFVNCMKNLQLM